ncbi:MAG: hypothetical protein GY940_29520 [bacterium]|nr:hypothetical protein [bacterium]
MPTIKIDRINAIGTVPLSYRGKAIRPEAPIWEGNMDRESGMGKDLTHSAAFLIDNPNPPALKVTLHITGAEAGSKVIVGGLYPDNDILFSGSGTLLENDETRVVVEIAPQMEPKEFFKIDGSRISWQVTRADTGKTRILYTPGFDLYWIYSARGNLFKRGIPVEILYQVSGICNDPAWRDAALSRSHPAGGSFLAYGKGYSVQESLVRWVVNYLFSRIPPKYDVSSGSPHLTTGFFDNITLKLDEYLESIDDPYALCNCFDQAAILQCYLKCIGISNVSYCTMEPFGFIKETRLAGTGACNNPHYACRADGKAVLEDPFDGNRTRFRMHAFCCWESEDGERRILDTSIGPHTGNETVEEYLDGVIDDKYHVLLDPGELGEIKNHQGVTNVNWNNSEECVSSIELSAGEFGSDLPGRFVVYPWPVPLECPVLAGGDWFLNYEDIITGTEEVIRTWQLRGENGAVNIDLYVSSSTGEVSLNRFGSILECCRMLNLPYEKGPDFLGHQSIMYRMNNQERYVWVYYNIVFDVLFQDVSFEIETMLNWMMDIPDAHIKDRIMREDRPPVDSIVCKPTEPRIKETVMVEIWPHRDIQWDFVLEGDGLRLINETNEYFCFKALKGVTGKLVVTGVNKRTLITEQKAFDIEVRKVRTLPRQMPMDLI